MSMKVEKADENVELGILNFSLEPTSFQHWHQANRSVFILCLTKQPPFVTMAKIQEIQESQRF